MYVEGLARRPGLAACELETPYAAEKIAQGDASFEAGERGAEAEVDSVSEGDMGIGVACDIEAVRVGEVAGVAIGRADHGEHQDAAWDRMAAQLDLAGRSAE